MNAKRRNEVIDELLERDGNRCFYCDSELIRGYKSLTHYTQKPRLLTIDHLYPRSRGGSDNLDNLVLSCRRCNFQKHDRNVDEYREWLAKHPYGGKTWDELARESHERALQEAGGWSSLAMPRRYIAEAEVANKDVRL